MPASLLLSDRAGFTPQIARLIGMMDYTRQTTLEAVQGLGVEELDFIPQGFGNSIGMLLEHFAAVERIYQLISTDHPDPDGALEAHWWPGLDLGARGREAIRGRPLRHYLRQLREVRTETLRLLGQHDDAWLEHPVPLWGGVGNRHFMWFHVFEDELSHRGQIRLLRAQLPASQERGLLGATFGPMTESGLGMRCERVYETSPADLAGLRDGDIVTEYEGQDVTNAEFYEIKLSRPPGAESRFWVQRGDEILELHVVRVARPA